MKRAEVGVKKLCVKVEKSSTLARFAMHESFRDIVAFGSEAVLAGISTGALFANKRKIKELQLTSKLSFFATLRAIKRRSFTIQKVEHCKNRLNFKSLSDFIRRSRQDREKKTRQEIFLRNQICDLHMTWQWQKWKRKRYMLQPLTGDKL